MCDTWGDPCRCPQRATDVARRRGVDKEVNRGRSRRESSEGPNLNLSVESAETANSATVAIKVEGCQVDRLGRERTESEPEGERPDRSEEEARRPAHWTNTGGNQ